MCDLYNETHPPLEPPPSYSCNKPLTFHSIASTYQNLQKFLPPSCIHVPPIVQGNTIKDVIFTANKLLSDLSLKENDHGFDNLIFPDCRPGPCIFPFTKTQHQILCALLNMDTS